jgi:hypothetical protein
MKPADPTLYEKAKKIVYAQYSKPSAYRSGALIKKYKEMGGTFIEDGKEKPLKRWFAEKWVDVNPNKTTTSYPVYRPTVKVSKKTPLTVSEIDKKDLEKKSREKQKIKGNKNLEPFKKK